MKDEDQADNYVPLPDATQSNDATTSEPASKTYGSDLKGVKDAAADADERLGRKSEVVERFRVDEQGKRLPDKFSVTLKRSARDLADAQRLEAEVNEVDAAGKFAAEVDAIRQDAAAPAKPEAGQQPREGEHKPQQQQQPPEQGQPDPELEKALSHPHVRAAIEGQITKAAQAHDTFVRATFEAAQLATAGMMAAVPELANVHPQRFPEALQIIAQHDPARFEVIKGHIARVQGLMVEHNRAVQVQQSQQAQVHQRQFQAYAAHEDAVLGHSLKGENPKVIQDASEAALTIATEFGLSRRQVAELWNTNPIFRAAPFQRMMIDAGRWRLATTAMKNAVPRQLPAPIRPGVSNGERPSTAQIELKQAQAAFDRNPNVKNGTELRMAKRRAAA